MNRYTSRTRVTSSESKSSRLSTSHCCIPIVQLDVYIYKYTLICGNIIDRKWTTSITNEYTSLQKYNSHTLFSKGWCSVVCERWVETGTKCYIDPSSSLDHSSTSSSSWLGLLNRGSLRAQSPQSSSWFSPWDSCLSCLDAARAPAYIISFRPPASAALLLIYSWLTAG